MVWSGAGGGGNFFFVCHLFLFTSFLFFGFHFLFYFFMGRFEKISCGAWILISFFSLAFGFPIFFLCVFMRIL